MKKLLTLLLAAALLLGLALPMTACKSEAERLSGMDEDKRAVRLLSLAEKAIGDASCIRFKRSLDIRNPYYASFHTETETVTCINGDDGMTYISDSKNKTKLVSEGTFINRKWGYVDGTYFTYHEEDGNESRYKAAMSQAEFEDSYLGMGAWGNLGFLFDEVDCSTLTSEQKEDGTWVSTYEGFSAGDTNAYLKSLGHMSTFMTDSHKPKDMLVNLYMDADLRPVYLSVEVVFHQNKNFPSRTPSAKVIYDFISWDAAELDESRKSVDLSKYTELPDMAVLNAFFDGLTAHEEGSGCDCIVTTTTTVGGWDENGQPTRVTGEVTQNINFATPGGLRFTMEYEQDGQRHELAYAGNDAFLTIYSKKGNKIGSQSVKMLDAQAYETVRGLLNPMAITPADVTSARLLNQGHGLYRYTLAENVIDVLWSNLMTIYDGAKLERKEVEAALEAEMLDGVLKRYTVSIDATLTVDGTPVPVEITVAVILY